MGEFNSDDRYIYYCGQEYLRRNGVVFIVNKESKMRCILVTQLCLNFCDSIGCRLPDSSVHGILQARTLEWVAIPFSRGSFWPRDQTWVSCIAGRFFTIWATRNTSWNAVLGCNLQNNRRISVHFHGKLFNITVIQVYAQHIMPKKLKLTVSIKTYNTF